ncbi:MAG: hypothetical protein AAGA10_27980 [Bacteroidota bacterium]
MNPYLLATFAAHHTRRNTIDETTGTVDNTASLIHSFIYFTHFHTIKVAFQVRSR